MMSEHSNIFDPYTAIALLWRRKVLIFICTLAVTLAAYGIVQLQPKRFESRIYIEIIKLPPFSDAASLMAVYRWQVMSEERIKEWLSQNPSSSLVSKDLTGSEYREGFAYNISSEQRAINFEYDVRWGHYFRLGFSDSQRVHEAHEYLLSTAEDFRQQIYRQTNIIARESETAFGGDSYSNQVLTSRVAAEAVLFHAYLKEGGAIIKVLPPTSLSTTGPSKAVVIGMAMSFGFLLGIVIVLFRSAFVKIKTAIDHV